MNIQKALSFISAGLRISVCKALHYPSLDLNARQLSDLELLLNRALYPLSGFLTRTDYDRVVADMRLADSTVWPMPICLDVKEEMAGKSSARTEAGSQ